MPFRFIRDIRPGRVSQWGPHSIFRSDVPEHILNICGALHA